MPHRFDRRTMLKAATVVAGAGFNCAFPPLLFAQASEDPVAIIQGFAQELLNLFGTLNGNSDSYSSRRQALVDVVDARFAYNEMAETAAAIALSKMTDTERRRLSAIGRDLVAEYLLSFFVLYGPENQFVVNGLRRSRSGNRSMLDTTVVSEDGPNYSIRWDIVERNGKYLIYDVRVFGISLINEVKDLATAGYERAGMYMLFRVLDRRIESFRQRFPD